jgi:hypothetical protein
MIRTNRWKDELSQYRLAKARAGLNLVLRAAICFVAIFATLVCLGVALVSLLATLVIPSSCFMFLYAALFGQVFAVFAGYLYDRAQAAYQDYLSITFHRPVDHPAPMLVRVLAHTLQNPPL